MSHLPRRNFRPARLLRGSIWRIVGQCRRCSSYSLSECAPWWTSWDSSSQLHVAARDSSSYSRSLLSAESHIWKHRKLKLYSNVSFRLGWATTTVICRKRHNTAQFDGLQKVRLEFPDRKQFFTLFSMAFSMAISEMFLVWRCENSAEGFIDFTTPFDINGGWPTTPRKLDVCGGCRKICRDNIADLLQSTS